MKVMVERELLETIVKSWACKWCSRLGDVKHDSDNCPGARIEQALTDAAQAEGAKCSSCNGTGITPIGDGYSVNPCECAEAGDVEAPQPQQADVWYVPLRNGADKIGQSPAVFLTKKEADEHHNTYWMTTSEPVPYTQPDTEALRLLATAETQLHLINTRIEQAGGIDHESRKLAIEINAYLAQQERK